MNTYCSTDIIRVIDASIMGAMMDERRPLPRCLTPVMSEEPDAAESTRDLVVRELFDGSTMALGNIAARVLRDVNDVGRSLLVLRLAGEVELVRAAITYEDNVPDKATSTWRRVAQ